MINDQSSRTEASNSRGNELLKAVNNVIVVKQESNAMNQSSSSTGDSYSVQNAGAVGRGAKAENVTIHASSAGTLDDVDLKVLKDELAQLKIAMLEAAMEGAVPEEDSEHAIVEISKAELAATKGDRTAVKAYLANAGRWSFGVATATGVAVAGAALKEALGL
ncbi:hypothetical protein [Actinomadura fibrosa]|uniref:DUF3618 domain-containing protein n=1 Tax=Actinomadura fibrosa TaxID=111802 RepID=A0ABW2XZ60_9ACTN|nr:hypothetical protein [Actinomadura fibrosa]